MRRRVDYLRCWKGGAIPVRPGGRREAERRGSQNGVPDGARLALTVDGARYFVHEQGKGTVCLVSRSAGGDTGQCTRQRTLLTKPLVIVSAHGPPGSVRTYSVAMLVPDSVTKVRAGDQLEVEPVQNVAVLDSVPLDVDSFEVLSGSDTVSVYMPPESFLRQIRGGRQ